MSTGLLKLIKQRLIDVTSFRLSKSIYARSVRFKRTNNFDSVFPDHSVVKYMRPDSRNTSALFFYFLFLVSL
jgi:hypothetical protein